MTERRSAMSFRARPKPSVRRGVLVGRYVALLSLTALLGMVPRHAYAESESAEAAPAKPFAVSLGAQAGIAYFTESGPFGTDSNIGLGLAPGYSLGVRASFEFFRWLALDARASLLHNDGNAFVSYGSVTTTGGMGAVRLTLPVPHIRPYALIGFGGYHMGGVEVGVEWLYSHLNNETLSTNINADGGDPSSLSFFVQYRLPL
jgi:Outer membrane protein beta-barrel domain